MKKEEIFSRVVENAFDFFDESLNDFDGKKYKYSIIHFCAAVELFLKARLLCEHWTLIIAKNREASLDEFISGRSQSATLDEIKKRLAFVAKDGISRQASNAFTTLAKHRNQVIHFCHPDLYKKNVSQIVSEQCRAWYFLQELLTIQWKKQFKQYTKQIRKIDKRIKKNREYLEEKFKVLRTQIEGDINKGIEFCACPTCTLKALQLSAETANLFNADCIVCGFKCNVMRVDCPSCSKPVSFVGEGYAKCSCGKDLNFNNLFDVLFDRGEADARFKDGDDSYSTANCCICDTYKSVIPYNNKYLCLNCFETVNSVYWCDWCNEPQTEAPDDSYLFGCQFCGGKWAEVKDD